MTPIRSNALVIFGIAGDLACRKLLPALYELDRAGRLDLPVVGIAPADVTAEQLRNQVRVAVADAFHNLDQSVVTRLLRRLTLVTGDYTDRAVFDRLAERIRPAQSPTYFLALPPSLFPAVVTGLAMGGLSHNARVMVEKPFGHDLASARELNRLLHSSFREDAIFRVDHYLGKESVENLMAFRFGNSFLEPLWNRDHVSSVKITHCETWGVGRRGSFYEGVGAIRDVVQNHLLQVVALIAMEPQANRAGDSLRDECSRVLRAIPSVDPNRLVRGQYVGYTAEPGVVSDSTVETYAAMRLEVNLPRWAGVPFYLRSGKSLAATAIEAVVELTPPSTWIPQTLTTPPCPNLIRFRLGRNPGVTMTVQVKRPGDNMETSAVDLRVDLAALGPEQEAYVRLLDDALGGSQRRFVRADAVEECWRIVAPALTDQRPLAYERGSWGPAKADELLGGDQWRPPETIGQERAYSG
jgi:glucose-6-phosphate 1-dehydrogenase